MVLCSQLVARSITVLAVGGTQLFAWLVGASGWSNRAHATEPVSLTRFDQVSAPLVRSDLQLQSSASCAATACHGGSSPGVANPAQLGGSEYPLWIERDPHALSWRTFCSDTSVAMMERLQIMRSGEVIDRAAYDNCLACHNTTRQFADKRASEPMREGVGCNGCHGPSDRWRTTHYKTNWNAFQAIADGFVPAQNMLVRARMCAACHVGDRDRDMNHDIIAAGHPALHYEFATFHQRLPKHWRDETAKDTARYEASQWLAGQVAALDASLVLLESRADQTLPVSQWPELAAYNCAACHQALRASDVGLASQSALATASFSSWNRFGVEELMRLRLSEHSRSSNIDTRLTIALQNVTSAMQAKHLSVNDTKQAAREARLALDAWLTSPAGVAELNQFDATRLRALAISAGADKLNLDNWERAAQFYLASIAAREAWPKPFGDSAATTSQSKPLELSELLSSARELRGALSFRSGTHSPQWPIGRTSIDPSRKHLEAIKIIQQHDAQSFVPTP